MAWFGRSERGIGRGETAESRIEAPFFAAFMILCAVLLFVFHVYIQNNSLTIAAAVTMIAFGATVIRVDIGISILVVAMLLSPEIEAGSVGASGERSVNLRYDDILIIVIFLGVLVKLAFEGRATLWKPNPINVGIFIYYLICIISTLDAWRISVPAWDRRVAFFVMLKMLEFYMIFFMVGLAMNDRRDIRRQLALFFIVALIVSLFGIFSIGTLKRVSAPFEVGGTEPNTLGGYLTIVICVAGGLFLCAPTPRKKLLFAATALIAFVPFIMTLSRASYLALLVAVLVLGAIARKTSIFAFVALVLVLSPFIMPQDVKDRVNYTFSQESGVVLTVGGRETDLQVDKSTYERIYVWQKVRYNLRIWPWLGGGVSWETVLDSQYARVLIETGLLGLAAFLFLLYRIFRATREAYRWSRDWMCKGLALGVSAATIGLMIHGMGTISFLIVRIMEPFWFLVALCMVARENALTDHVRRLKAYRQEHEGEQETELEPVQTQTPVPSQVST